MAPAQRSICVFCGARSGTNPAHTETARAMGTAIAAEGWRLVYGAGDVGPVSYTHLDVYKRQRSICASCVL